MEFILGTHLINWLERIDLPLMVSYRSFLRRKSPIVATAPWTLDSGGFTELSMFGEWVTSPQQYADDVMRIQQQTGNLKWAAIQDWMVEPFIREKTGLSLKEHQYRTVDSFATLRHLAPSVPWMPVLQGWKIGDYHEHVEMYARFGFNLRKEPIVGLGSVCRRQATSEISEIVKSLSFLKLHGFGMKAGGILRCAKYLTSSDSLAWSFTARNKPPMKGHTHKNCANCLPFALLWREKIITLIQRILSLPHQLQLPGLQP